MSRPSDTLAGRLLEWFDRHGRKDLPWHAERTAYAVWISEIMLQQTQVSTVIPYFRRFMARFPEVNALAEASEDEVLHLWSGLGYYSRARNLHAAARCIVEEHGGRMPRRFENWLSLPGVGRSTAGAILALAFGERHPILDGNVKRVLCRYHGIEGWPGESTTEKTLWALADGHTPAHRVRDYTQAIMDLGATVCVRSRPRCGACPLCADCRALMAKRTGEIPAPRPKTDRPLRSTRFLVMRGADGAVLLERRPPSGVWGGLWGFPECAPEVDPAHACLMRFGLEPLETRYLNPVQHGFTHFRLAIEPVLLDVNAESRHRVMEGESTLWYKGASDERVGLAAPVRRILDNLPR